MFIEGPASCDHRCGVYGAQADCSRYRAEESCRFLNIDFGEHLPSKRLGEQDRRYYKQGSRAENESLRESMEGSQNTDILREESYRLAE
jgi:hypothetical protein